MNPLPVLTGLKLAAQDGSLVVTGTDLEIGIARFQHKSKNQALLCFQQVFWSTWLTSYR